MLKIVPVTLIGPLNKINTFALLDEGSTVTLLKLQTARDIGLSEPIVRHTIKGLRNHEIDVASEKVNLQIAGEFGKFNLKNINTVNHLSLPSQSVEPNLVKKFNQLHSLSLRSYN